MNKKYKKDGHIVVKVPLSGELLQVTMKPLLLLMYGKRYRFCEKTSAGRHGQAKPICFPALPIVQIVVQNFTIAPVKALKPDKTILFVPL